MTKEGVKVSIPHLPGFGSRLNRPWDLNDYLSWLKRKIKKKTILLGHSFGGRIALKFAAEYPTLVEKLILVDAAGVRDKRWPSRLKRAVFKKIACWGKRLKITGLRRWLYFLAGEKDYYRAQGCLRQTMAKIIEEDLEPLLTKIKVPVLIIWGRKDKVTPLWMAERIRLKVRNSKLKIINCSHSPHLQAPEKLAKIISQWLS